MKETCKLVSHVDLRINNVNLDEVNSLNTLIGAIHNPEIHDDFINTSQGKSDYIVTVSPADLTRLKDALREILKIVRAERIDIET